LATRRWGRNGGRKEKKGEKNKMGRTLAFQKKVEGGMRNGNRIRNKHSGKEVRHKSGVKIKTKKRGVGGLRYEISVGQNDTIP